MDIPILFFLIIIPAVSALFALLGPKWLRKSIAVAGSVANTILTLVLITTPQGLSIPWAGTAFAFRLDAIAGLMLLTTATISLLVILYCIRYLEDTSYAYTFYPFLLLALALINGALVSDNLTTMLFFWEALLIPLFGMIATAHKDAYKTAVKAFVIIGITDLCLMFGMALIEHMEKTLTISQICVPLGGIGSIAFVFMMIGAVSKAGAVPFHSWISDAAGETPLAFTAFLPGSLSRLLGIYFLARMTSEMFRFSPCSRVAWLIVALGIASLGIGLFFAPAQKEPKKLLGFISIALCGVLLVSIGSGLSGNPLHTAVLIAGSTILFTLVFLVVGVQEQRCATFTTALSMRVRNITPFKALHERSDQGQFDPYELAMIVFNFFAKTAFALDRFTNWIYDGFIPFCAVMLSTIIRVFHTGNYAAYIIWSLAGTVTVIAFMIK